MIKIVSGAPGVGKTLYLWALSSRRLPEPVSRPREEGQELQDLNSFLDPIAVYYWGEGFHTAFMPLRWRRFDPDSIPSWPLTLEAGTMVLVDGWVSLVQHGDAGA